MRLPTRRLPGFLVRTLLVGAAALGLILHIVETRNLLQLFSYYTIQSNLLVFLVFFVLLARDVQGKPETRFLVLARGAATLAIQVTFLVSHFLLRSPGDPLLPHKPSTLLVHYLVPVLTLVDYLVADAKGRLRLADPLAWALVPLAYPVYVLVYVRLGGRFSYGASTTKVPYFFLDVERLGLLGVAGWILAITAGFMVLAYMLVGLDRLLGRREAHRVGAKDGSPVREAEPG